MKNKVWSKIRRCLPWLALACGLLAQSEVWAATCTSTGGSWGTNGTWANCNGGTPQAGDTAVINSGTVTLNTSATIAGLTVNGGTLALGNSGTARTLTVNGNILVASGATLNVNNNTVVHILNVTGNVTNHGTLDLVRDANSLCTANFTGAAAQTIDGSSTGVTEFSNVSASNNLVINKSGAAVTQTGTLTVNGSLTVQAGTLAVYNTTTIAGSTDISGTLSIAATTGTKTFTGAVTLNSGGTWSNAVNEAVTFQGGLTHNGSTFTAGTGVYTFDTNAQSIGGSSALAIPSVTVNGVTLTNTGTLTVATALSGTGGLTNDTNATLNIGGTSAIFTLTASATGNTVNYTGGGQTVKATTYHHLGLSGSGAKTIAGVTTINGNLTLSGAATAIASSNLSIGGDLSVGAGTTFTVGNITNFVGGNTSVSGTLAHSVAGSKTYVGAVTINAGGVWTNTGSSPVTLRGGLTHNGATFTAGIGVYTFDTNAQSIGGSSALAIPNVTVTGVTLTNTGTLTVATALSGTGGLTNDANATLNIGGTSAITTLTASASGNTVNYTQAGAQTVKTTSYYNLGCSGSGVKSLAGGVTVGGTLTLSGATLAVGANTLTLNGPTIAGTPANLTTTASSSLVFGGSSTGVSVPSSVTALNNLTVNNASGVTLGSSPTLNGTLTLGSGVITTGANTLTLAAFCPGSYSRTGGHVNGNLTLTFPTGNPTCTFHVGDSIGYAPITVAMSGVTVAGRLAGRVDAGDHPDTTAGASGIDASKSANHYWTLSAGTPAMTYTSYSATFQFCANTLSCVTPTEVDTGAVTSNFLVARKNGGSWSMPSVGTLTAYSSQATGITSTNGFGEFSVGEANLCFTDAFTGTDGSSPGVNWSVNNVSGSFGNPVIVGNRLRLTNATTSVSTWATLLRPFPAAGNKITVEFDYYDYGGTGGDGVAVVLSDGSVAPVVGAYGGSLGYAQKAETPVSDCTTPGGCPGFAGGWLGIGLDAYGNYSTSAEGRYGGSASPVPDGVAVRGSGTGVSGYRFLQGTTSLSPGVDGVFTPPHRYRIILDHTNSVNAYASVERDTGSGYVSLIAPFDAKNPGYSQSAVPTKFNLSFTGATGASTNIHEIDNLKVCTTAAITAPSLHHIQLEHGGSACTGSAATVSVKACADQACSSLYGGSVTVNLTATAGTWSTDPITFSGGQVDVSLTYGTPGSVTLGGTATSPTTGNATRCFNGATETCTLTYSACSVDVVEVGAALGTPIYTKLSNVAFNLDVVRYSGNQTINSVQLVDASSGTCTTHSTLGTTTTTLPLTLNNTNPRRTVAFTYNNAVANARVRVTNSGGVTSCSNDNFAIRPQAFAVTSTASNAGSSGTPVFRAGTDAFAMTAAAVYGATTTPGYAGTPRLNASLVSTSQAHLGALTATAFPAASAGVSTASGLMYDEVGNFNLGQYAVYDDAFAAVDSVKGECTTGFSNTLDGDGKYSCQFGSAASGPFGRFVPDHFTVMPAVANACAAGGFTYLGQPFNFSTASVVEARNAGNAITVNYAGAYAAGAVAFGAENQDSGTDMGGSLVFEGTGLALSGAWASGVFILTDSATAVRFTRPTTPVGPYEELHIGMTVNDADVATVPRVAGADMNPAAVGGSPTHKELAGSPLRMRYGRLRLLNAYGSERLALPMGWETQYWNGQSFIRNTLDSCTSFGAANIALDNYQSPPKAVPPLLSAGNVGTVTVGAISAGRGTITLAPTAYATGSVDLVANLGSTGLPSNCAGLSEGTSAPAGLAYLSGQWCGAANDRNPTARASFGVYKSPLIYRRENY